MNVLDRNTTSTKVSSLQDVNDNRNLSKNKGADVTVGRWLPSQDPMARAALVAASGKVEDDGSRMAVGCCPRAIDKSSFPSLEQGELRDLESRLLASAYSMASLLHW